MIMDNIQELVLEDVTFDEARQNFNRVLQRLFRSMLDSGSSDGSITLKIDVSLTREYIPNNDPDIEGESREIHKPKFDHKVSSTVTVKDELKGNKNPEMELVWDEEKQMYVLAYIANTGQKSIFDKDQPWNQDGKQPDGDGQEHLETDPKKTWMNTPLLPGEVADEGALPGEVANNRALPGEVQNPEDDVIDGSFREVVEAENKAGNDASGENTGEEPQTPPGGDNEAEGDDYGYEEPEEPEE